MKTLKGISIILISLAAIGIYGYAQTYWAFPSEKDSSLARLEMAQCQQTTSQSDCLRGKGYKEISREEYLAMQTKALENARKPIDVVARDVAQGYIFAGKVDIVGAKTQAVEIVGMNNSMKCVGSTTITTMVGGGGKGTTGTTELLCDDGRKMSGTFVMETARSGYGFGIDNTGAMVLQILFGDYNMNVDQLRTTFDDYFKKKREEHKKQALEKDT